MLNQDPAEIAKFDAVAQRWWDPKGEFRPLHELNPVRVDYIDRRVGLRDKRVLDVGCGGGLLSEAMAARGAHVTGIDLGQSTLEVARLHLLESGLAVDYRQETAEAHATQFVGRYDVVTCLEMLEHVPDPESVLASLFTLVRPGGDVVLSTLNRNLKSFLLGIVAAEYVLGLVARGTHSYERFIRPSELGRWARGAGFMVDDLSGLGYDPFAHSARVTRDVDVNYIMHLRRPAA
jgi:2-polyprenyl-6-hydroxyphenyl methylase/3-demethylubiquinone-9 3-methyltransferase